MSESFEIFKYLFAIGTEIPDNLNISTYINIFSKEIKEEILEKREIAIKYSGNPFIHKVIDHGKHKEFDQAANKFMRGNDIRSDEIMDIDQFNYICSNMLTYDQITAFFLISHKRAGRNSDAHKLVHDLIIETVESFWPKEIMAIIGEIDLIAEN